MYWETLSRWISQRAKRDARELGVPLVFLQAVDECNTIDREAAQRLLNVPNMHNTGNSGRFFRQYSVNVEQTLSL